MSESEGTSTPEEEQGVGGFTRGRVAAEEVALGNVIEEQSAESFPPAEWTTGSNSPLFPSPLRATMVAELDAAGINVVKAETECSLPLIPSQPESPFVISPPQQKQSVENAPAVVEVGVTVALLSLAPGEGCESGSIPTSSSTQPMLEPTPQSHQPSPTPNMPEGGRAPQETRPRLFSSLSDVGGNPAHRRLVDEKGRNSSSTLKRASTRSIKNGLAGGPTSKGSGRKAAAAAAVTPPNEEPKAYEARPKRSSTPKPIPTNSMNNVIDRTAVALVAAATVAEAKKERRRSHRGSCAFQAIMAKAAGSDRGFQDAGVCTASLAGLRPPRRAVDPPAPGVLPMLTAIGEQEVSTAALPLSAATTRRAGGNAASSARRTSTGNRGGSVPHLPIEGKDARVEMRMEVKAVNGVWDHEKLGEARVGLASERVATRKIELGRGLVSEQNIALLEAVDSGDPSVVRAVVGSTGMNQAAEQLSALRINDDQQLESIIMLAASGGDVEVFHTILRALHRTLTDRQIEDVLGARGVGGRSLLTSAAEGGNEAVFMEVVNLMGGKRKGLDISPEEAGYLMEMAIQSGNTGVLNKATKAVLLRGKGGEPCAIDHVKIPNQTSVLVEEARTGTGAVIEAVVTTMTNLLTKERAVIELTSCAGPRGMSALMVAAERGSVEVLTAVMRAVSPLRIGLKAIHNLVMATDIHGMTALSYAANSGVLEVIRIVSALMARYLRARQLGTTNKLLDAYSSSLATCCGNLPTPTVAGCNNAVDGERLKVISYLLRHGAKPGRFSLVRLSTSVEFPRFKETLLAAVSSAQNPFIPGMNLSIALAEAVILAKEGEKRALLVMQAAVDELLLEVIEHLPQTVTDFDGEMEACSAVLEPESVMPGHEGTMGPLDVALTKRRQMEMFCTVPLVVNFMWRKFAKGLPSHEQTNRMLEENRVISNPEQPLFRNGLLAEGGILALGIASQRGYKKCKLSSITYFPRARIIVVGFLARPDNYYKVPALRMVLDFVTYLCMMVVFGGFVLLNDDNSFDWAEIVFAFYICGSIVTEFRAIFREPWVYMLDRWNVVDVTCLCLMTVSLWFRAFGPIDSIVSRCLYALSAPLAFGRILFYAQILPSQGPMIQAIFSMTGDLANFGSMLFVVMGGFVMSFYSIVKERVTFGQVWLDTFIAMLGETEAFDYFSGSKYDNVGTVLLVTYLVLSTLVILNLLVAVLSKAYATINKNVDREYKVSKARLIQHYVSVVKPDRLPAPFNVFQWVFSSPMLIVDWFFSTTLHEGTKLFVGRTVFWAILGPPTVAGGWLLWVSSTPKAVPLVWRVSTGNRLWRRLGRVALVLVCCTVIAPFWLYVLWVKGGLTRVWAVIACSRRRGRRVRRDSETTVATAKPFSRPDYDGEAIRGVRTKYGDVVTAVLKETGRGVVVGELQRYLDESMSDPYVRRGEKTRATTMRHVKLLRNRLEATTKAHIDELQSYLVRANDDLSRQVEDATVVTRGNKGRNHKITLRPSELETIFSTRVRELDRRLDAKTAELEQRVAAMIDERLGVVVQKLGAAFGKAGE